MVQAGGTKANTLRGPVPSVRSSHTLLGSHIRRPKLLAVGPRMGPVRHAIH
jgi:hypothetical protein